MKQKFLFAISILVGIFAAALSHFWLASKEADYRARAARFASQESEIVASSRSLPAGTPLQASDFVKIDIPTRNLTDDNVMPADYSRLIGKTLNHTIERGSPILWTYIDGGKERPRSLSTDIQRGMRAVSIPVSGASGVSGLVRPNDCVDVLGSFSLPASSGGGAAGAADEVEMVTMTVLQNVTILAIGSDTQRSLQDGRGNAGGYSTVTLQVTPREAEVLVFAQQMRGRLFLTLRNSADVYFEEELPRVDFNQIESELKDLNKHRQEKIRGARSLERK